MIDSETSDDNLKKKQILCSLVLTCDGLSPDRISATLHCEQVSLLHVNIRREQRASVFQEPVAFT